MNSINNNMNMNRDWRGGELSNENIDPIWAQQNQ